MRRIFVLLLLSHCLCLTGCSEDGCPLKSEEPSVCELEDITKQNCRIVLDAIEAFAADNSGSYPGDTHSDTTRSGLTLIDLLPGGVPLTNPFSGMQTEPVDSTASRPGETGYSLIRQYTPGAYVITGFGADSLIVEITNIAALEDSVRWNCLLVQVAAEAFAAQNGGVYANDVDCDTTPAGDTVVDLLPGGTLLRNPFTGARTEPINGAAANPGEIGYVPCVRSAVNRGYVITGCGALGGTIIVTLVRDCE